MNGMNLNIKKRIMALEPHLTTYQKPNEDQQVQAIVKHSENLLFQGFDLILRTIDGQIVEEWTIFDELALRRQMAGGLWGVTHSSMVGSGVGPKPTFA